jgi:putative ABC transport system permease protein
LQRAFALGLKSLWLHRLRSLLTVLGIVFGVCSVIAMLAIGEGVSYEVQEQLRQLGSSNIIMRSIKPPEEQNASSERTFVVEYGITYKDVERIENTIPGVASVAPARIIRRNVWNGEQRVDCDIFGTLPSYPIITNHRVIQGSFFTEFHLIGERNVCLIEEGMARELFPIDDPIGKSVRVDDDYFTVIGVIAPQVLIKTKGNGAGANGDMGPAGGGGRGAPNRMYIPLSAAKSRFGEILVKRSSGNFSAERIELHEAIVNVEREEDVLGISRVISGMMDEAHKQNDYEIVVPLELLRRAEETKRIFNLVLGAVAAISLLVGGIGIMNIMLATVTERTREIGIRRALGAKRRDIIFQFLIETVLLSGVGGLLGVALGLAIPYIISQVAEMRTIVTFWSPLIAFGISAVVGVIFGIYPAMRAADMDPVEALRHE